MSEKLRWGILGTGNIAKQFCTGVNASRRCVLAAVGSRQVDTARDFAAAFNVPHTYGSYDELIGDPDVDAVYNSLPNSLHKPWTIAALRAGKHVLCEKPLAMNAGEAEEMFDEAERAGRVLVEAFMYRSHPLTLAVEEALRGGAIGGLRLIRTSFCYRTTRIAGNVRFVPELGGGALMDIGCYCTSFARHFAGSEPVDVQAVGKLHETGVDEMAAGSLLFPGGVIASFTCGMSAQADNTAYLCGTDGFIEVPVPWKPPSKGATFVVTRGTPPRMDKGPAPSGPPPRDVWTVDAGVELYGVEADDFAATVLDRQPPRVTRQDSVGNMVVLDELRRQVGMGF